MKIFISTLLLLAPASHGQNTAFGVIQGHDTDASIRAFWTPERIANARPIEPQRNDSDLPFMPATWPPESHEKFQTSGQPPTVRLGPDWQPDTATEAAIRELIEQNERAREHNPEPGTSGPTPDMVGTSGLYFTSTRLVPITADIEYPYHAVGKLVYSIPGQPGVVGNCTASVINLRLIVTAGHCVTNGQGTEYQNFMFTPAYRNGAAPFGTWTWANIGYVPIAWLSGGGGVPNSADYAILVMQDGVPGAGGTPPKLGGVTGFLGVATYATSPNNLFILGYPGNLDGGNMMHQVNAGQYTSAGSGTVKYGCDMGGGASGGPWIQNFGAAAAGQVGGATNQVVGVSSYGNQSAAPMYMGASVFTTIFQGIYQAACAQRAGNCQ